MGYKLKRATIWQNGTELQLRPTGWHPGANTIAYRPLESDTNDYSGNSRNLTNSWVTFVNNIGWATVPVGYWDWWDSASMAWNVQLNAWYTVCRRAKVNSSTNVWLMFDLRNEIQEWQGFAFWRCYNNQISFYQQKSSSVQQSYTESLTSNWTYWCVTWDGSAWTIYKNWTQANQAAINNSIDTSSSYLWIWCRHQTLTDNLDGYMSKVIIENTPRDAQAISDYYNQTKWDYWL
jgi:hypothetical protein